jgi:hypothetical protein
MIARARVPSEISLRLSAPFWSPQTSSTLPDSPVEQPEVLYSPRSGLKGLFLAGRAIGKKEKRTLAPPRGQNLAVVRIFGKVGPSCLLDNLTNICVLSRG